MKDGLPKKRREIDLTPNASQFREWPGDYRYRDGPQRLIPTKDLLALKNAQLKAAITAVMSVLRLCRFEVRRSNRLIRRFPQARAQAPLQ